MNKKTNGDLPLNRPSGIRTKKIFNVRFSIQTITPHNAKVMLERRRPGHNINPVAVRAYADAMRAGAWVLNGMPIIFATDGSLLDGVQRLQAAVLADMSFPSLVAEDVREDTLHTIDQHRRRSYTGVLESRDEDHAGALMRLMSKLIRYDNGLIGMPDSQISWMRYDQVLDQNPILREAIAMSYEQRNLVLRATARHALVFMGLAAGQRQEVWRFLEILRSPEDFPHSEPAALLAMQLRIANEQNSRFSVDTTLAMAILAFNDQISGKRHRSYNWEPSYGSMELDRNGQPLERRKLRKLAPPNLGMPKLLGYPGLKGARYDSEQFKPDSPLGQTLASAGHAFDPGEFDLENDLVAHTLEPEEAQQWLNLYNRGNRKILPEHVQTIARDIRNGAWMFNAQPICFSVSGRMLNGQHRTKGVVVADQAIDVLLIRNLPEEAFATYDIQARKIAPIEGIADVRADMRVVAAAAKLQWAMDEIEAGRPVSSRPSATEIKRTIEAHPGLVEAFPRARRMKDIASTGIMNYIIYRVRSERPDIAEDFLDGLETGAGLQKTDPLLKTRNDLMIERHMPGAYRRKRFMNLILACWDEYKTWRDDPEEYAAQSRRRSRQKVTASMSLLDIPED